MGGLVILYLTLLDAKDATIAANRAWIASLGLDVDGALEVGRDLPVKIYYVNVGKSPALGLKFQFIPFIVRGVLPTTTTPITVGENKACDGLVVNAETGVSFPNSGKDTWQITNVPSSNISAEIISGASSLLLEGCFGYNTMGEIHKTKFCYTLEQGSQQLAQIASSAVKITSPVASLLGAVKHKT